jgi:hypothetical protein
MDDDQVEDDCIENEDASPIGLDEEWPNGDSPHVGCRCSIAPWLEPLDEGEDEEGGFPPLAARARAREAAGNQKPWPADKVEQWTIDRLIPYAKNARTHTDAQVAAIAASIKEWGWTSPALVGEDGGLIAGQNRADQVLVCHPARGRCLRSPGRPGKVAMADRARLSGAQAGTRPR